ncbi:hypothetical protein [Clostridium chromiireducens]|uniref:Uncharacterized protein n=1 Tax=Clostridium chromiireducens TaxID=225345 RepID=A0A1V4IMJ5_9CLOT|nr:hypothetical protein [Clostridium chromiireducens]MVX62418.1 hypothetical protein [Clostridium chromiireducens]OPJ60995.1 hypothetical protein CLCHR_26630 [Clostridium chromiireducens]RII36237.1 hypothetical protein D2A34_02330 [Clostridium chromiireducens]
MLSNIPIEAESYELDSFIYKRKRRLKRHIVERTKRKRILFLSTSLTLIIVSAFLITNNIYLSKSSKDLGFAVEYNFTTGFFSDNKLLRVQKMSLIYYDGETAIVEASGLSKAPPHKNTSLKGSFKKDENKSWYLEKNLS